MLTASDFPSLPYDVDVGGTPLPNDLIPIYIMYTTLNLLQSDLGSEWLNYWYLPPRGDQEPEILNAFQALAQLYGIEQSVLDTASQLIASSVQFTQGEPAPLVLFSIENYVYSQLSPAVVPYAKVLVQNLDSLDPLTEITNLTNQSSTFDLSADTTIVGFTNGSASDTQVTITGATFGLLDSTTIPLIFVTNYGTITGTQNTGVSIIVGITLTNFGSIAGGAGGVNLAGGSNIVNSTNASITGGIGVLMGAGNDAVVNWGTITGIAGAAVEISGPAGFAIQNGEGPGAQSNTTALISGSSFGILIEGGPGGSVVTNYGTIVGGVGGIGNTSAGSITVTNYGTIGSSTGASGTAIQFGSGTSSLVEEPGSSIIGEVVGGSGSASIDSSAMVSASIIQVQAGTGPINVLMGPQETLQLENPGSFTGTISNFVQGNTIDLAGISATEATLTTGGVLTVQEVDGSTLALTVPGVQGNQGLRAVPDGNGGTDILLSPPPPQNAITDIYTGNPFDSILGGASFAPGSVTATVTFGGVPADYSGPYGDPTSFTISALGQTISSALSKITYELFQVSLSNGLPTAWYINVATSELDIYTIGSGPGDPGDTYAYDAAMETISNTGGPTEYTGGFTTSKQGIWTIESTVACFVSGSRIATPEGELPVDRLSPGDKVLTLRGGARPIIWMGRRHIDCRRHPKPQKVWPVRVHTGAFGDGLPQRDLWLSPDHAVFVDDVLIPVKHLINGMTIEQVPVDEVTYYHIELDQHDILLAEGLPAESYLDAGDRSNFDNPDGVMRLFPDFSSRSQNACALWETGGCARLVITGRELDATRWCVNALAAAVGRRASGMPVAASSA